MGRHLNIPGSEMVIDLYGEWPTFHDAEVCSVLFDRSKLSGDRGPTVTVKIHGFTITSEVTDAGTLKTINHADVTFEFYDVVDLTLKNGFGKQNPVVGVSVQDIRSHQLEGIRFDVGFGGHFECDLEFKCGSMAVLSVERTA